MKHSTARWLVSITAALAPLPAVAERFALVVGENEPAADSGLAPLRYADDDALRHADLLRAAGAQVETLVVLDDTTQRRFPGAAAALAAQVWLPSPVRQSPGIAAAANGPGSSW